MRSLPYLRPLARGFIRSVCRAALPLALVMVTSTPAWALSGLYLQLGGGIADYSGTQLIVKEDPNSSLMVPSPPDLRSDSCCAPLAMAAQFRVGYSIFGFGGPEFAIVGTGWDGFAGGGGFIGGGLRLYPLKLFSLVGLDTDDFPIDLSTAATFGGAIVGQDFAYTGTFWDIDVMLDYKLTSFLNLGLKLDIILPNFNDFVFTSFSNDRGRCLDGSGNQVLDNGGTPVGVDEADCNGKGPSTTVLSPQLVFTFHFLGL